MQIFLVVISTPCKWFFDFSTGLVFKISFYWFWRVVDGGETSTWERNIDWLPLSCTLTEVQTHNLGICPWPWFKPVIPWYMGTMIQTTKPHWPGQGLFSLLGISHGFPPLPYFWIVVKVYFIYVCSDRLYISESGRTQCNYYNHRAMIEMLLVLIIRSSVLCFCFFFSSGFMFHVSIHSVCV